MSACFLICSYHAVDIFEESYVTQLVQLVMTDGLDGHLLLNICNICFGSCRLQQYQNPGSLPWMWKQNL